MIDVHAADEVYINNNVNFSTSRNVPKQHISGCTVMHITTECVTAGRPEDLDRVVGHFNRQWLS